MIVTLLPKSWHLITLITGATMAVSERTGDMLLAMMYIQAIITRCRARLSVITAAPRN